MADLGDIGFVQALASQTGCRGGFTSVKQPTNVVINITDANPYTGGNQINPVYFFSQEGTFVQRSDVDGSGNAYAYDLDDGGYYAQQIGTGNSWSITVSGTTVTIIRLSSFGTQVSIYAA